VDGDILADLFVALPASTDAADGLERWRGTDLLQESQEIGLALFPHDLAIGKLVKVQGTNRNLVASGRGSEEVTSVGPLHLKPRGNLVALGDRLFQSPLNVGKPAAQHRKQGQVTVGPTQRFAMRWRVELRIRGDHLSGKLFVGRVDELDESLHHCIDRFR
jgi:hypothetical protein